VERVLRGQPVVPGVARGLAVISREALSFWGGLNSATGEVIDRRHDRSGTVVAGKVFVFPSGKGSSTGSAVLLEAIRAGCAPAAIINCDQGDPILALGAIVADALYGRTIPLLALSSEDFNSIGEGDWVEIALDGTLRVKSFSSSGG